MHVSRPMLGLIVVAALFGSVDPVRSDETLDDIKRKQKIAADEFKARVRDDIAEAAKQAKSAPAKAAQELEAVKARVSFSSLIDAETKQELLNQLNGRIKEYRTSSAGTPGGADDVRRELQERQRQREQRDRELSQAYRQISDAHRKGDYTGAAAISSRMKEKFPDSPGFANAGRMANAQKALTELRGIRDERDRRWRASFVELMKSSMPIEGDVEFPANWKELTKRRTEQKLDPKEAALLKALNTPIKLELKDQPIGAILRDFETRYNIVINLDKIGLDQVQLTSESVVSINAKGETLRTVLRRALGDVGLTFSIRQGELRVTTPQRAADDMVVRTYYIGDLVQGTGFAFDPIANQIQAVQTIASLINQIQSIDPQSWASADGTGKGTIFFDPARMALVVKQSAEMQFMLQGKFR